MVNRYTKSAFAIIATALVAIAAQNGVGFAFANIASVVFIIAAAMMAWLFLTNSRA
jgi:hypothetical protein